MEITHCSVHGCTSGMKGLRVDVMTWRMTQSLDIPQHPEMTKNIQNVNELVHSDRRMTVRVLAEELGLRRTNTDGGFGHEEDLRENGAQIAL